jgi:type IV conjugative transfer system lipoprotein TraV
MNKFTLLLLLCLNLSGCLPHKMNFDCNAGKGVGCKSLSQVNDMVEGNTLDAEIAKAQGIKEQPICATCAKPPSPSAKLAPMSPVTLHVAAGPVARTPEKVMRVWFNSHFDQYGNFQGEQYVYTVIETSRWVVK